MNNNMFTLPSTPTCRVEYEVRHFGPNREPVQPYMTFAIIPTPKSTGELQTVMLGKHVGLSQVKNVVPVEPSREFRHSHPAAKTFAKYATVE